MRPCSQHVEAGEPCLGQRREDARRGRAQRLVERGRLLRDIDRDGDDRRRGELHGERRARARPLRSVLKRRRSTVVQGSRFIRSERVVSLTCEGVAQLERDLRGGRIAPCRLGLEAAQDDFLEPAWTVGTQHARRNRSRHSRRRRPRHI